MLCLISQKYSKDSLHAAVVEIYIKKGGYCRYSTVQNWSNNIVNLVTKRAYVEENGHMEWIDGNIGSMVNMKYPACILKGDHSKGVCISIYCAKIVSGVLTKEDIIVPYEKELYKYFIVSNEIKDNRIWTYEERIITAASYLTFTFNCSNGDYVQQRVFEELSECS